MWPKQGQNQKALCFGLDTETAKAKLGWFYVILGCKGVEDEMIVGKKNKKQKQKQKLKAVFQVSDINHD